MTTDIPGKGVRIRICQSVMGKTFDGLIRLSPGMIGVVTSSGPEGYVFARVGGHELELFPEEYEVVA